MIKALIFRRFGATLVSFMIWLIFLISSGNVNDLKNNYVIFIFIFAFSKVVFTLNFKLLCKDQKHQAIHSNWYHFNMINVWNKDILSSINLRILLLFWGATPWGELTPISQEEKCSGKHGRKRKLGSWDSWLSSYSTSQCQGMRSSAYRIVLQRLSPHSWLKKFVSIRRIVPVEDLE